MLRRGVLAFLLLKLTTLLVNLRCFPVLTASAGPATATGPAADSVSRVSLLVPVRNEGARLRRTLPALLAQPGVDELLVLDDESTDDSAAVVASLLDRHPHARLVPGRAKPDGWVGKTWACDQLAEHATGSLLVYCDADVVLADGAVAATVEEMRRQQADVFSVFPRQRTGSLGERLITPLVDDVLLCFLAFPLLRAPAPAAATANGSLLVLTRAAHDSLGGFASVRWAFADDVALARATRRTGLRLGLALGGAQVQTRMYDGYRQVVHGLGRGVRPVLGDSRVVVAAAAAWHVASYSWPVMAARRDRRWLLPLGLGVLERALVAAKTDPAAVWQAVLTPLSPLAFLPVAVQSMRREQQWKGRSYA